LEKHKYIKVNLLMSRFAIFEELTFLHLLANSVLLFIEIKSLKDLTVIHTAR